MDESGLGEDYEDENKTLVRSILFAVAVLVAVVLFFIFKD